MTNIAKKMLAGLAATIVLLLLMLMKGAMDLMPALDPIGMIATMMGVSSALAWGVHFMIGAVICGGAPSQSSRRTCPAGNFG